MYDTYLLTYNMLQETRILIIITIMIVILSIFSQHDGDDYSWAVTATEHVRLPLYHTEGYISLSFCLPDLADGSFFGKTTVTLLDTENRVPALAISVTPQHQQLTISYHVVQRTGTCHHVLTSRRSMS